MHDVDGNYLSMGCSTCSALSLSASVLFRACDLPVKDHKMNKRGNKKEQEDEQMHDDGTATANTS
jgi:hypothetical protein